MTDTPPLSKKKQLNKDKWAFLAKLKNEYPVIFRHPFSPLKINIDKDIAAAFPDVPEKVIRATLLYHVNQRGYLLAVKQKKPRVNLLGNEIPNSISDDECEYAKLKLKAIFKKDKARKKQKEANEEKPAQTSKEHNTKSNSNLFDTVITLKKM